MNMRLESIENFDDLVSGNISTDILPVELWSWFIDKLLEIS